MTTKEKKTDRAFFIFLSAIVLLLLLSVIGFNYYELLESKTDISECEVIDKYVERKPNARSTKDSYHLILQFNDREHVLEKNISISEKSFYEDVKIGDYILCNVTYTDDRIIDLTIADESIEQGTANPSMKAMVYFLIIFFLAACLYIAFSKENNT